MGKNGEKMGEIRSKTCKGVGITCAAVMKRMASCDTSSGESTSRSSRARLLGPLMDSPPTESVQFSTCPAHNHFSRFIKS